LHDTFGKEKVKQVSERTLSLCCKTQDVFKHIVFGAESVSTAPNDVISEKIIVLFFSFYNN